MSSTSAITQALTSLLPSYPASNKPFPTQLISQAESLLALSRQRHANLKSEEEIARAHACTEIACIRLRATLRLPSIKSGAGAPCKPTTYKKLIKFLDTALGDVNPDLFVGSVATKTGSGSRVSTPQGRKRAADGSVKKSGNTISSIGRSSRAAQSQSQGYNFEDESPSKKPSKRAGEIEFVGRIESKSRSRGNVLDGENLDAPSFVMPSIRKICSRFRTSACAPHVYTGTCIILKLSGLWPRYWELEEYSVIPGDGNDMRTAETEEREENDVDQRFQRDVSTLVIALYIQILTRMRKGLMTTEIYHRVLEESIRALDLSAASEQEEEEQQNLDVETSVEQWIERFNAEGWCVGQDWWDSVPEDVVTFRSRKDTSIHDGDENENERGHDAVNDKGNKTSNSIASSRGVGLSRKAELEQDDPVGILLPGLGTMYHEGIDWMSADKKLDFQDWKKDLLKRIAAMDRADTARAKGKERDQKTVRKRSNPETVTALVH